MKAEPHDENGTTLTSRDAGGVAGDRGLWKATDDQVRSELHGSCCSCQCGLLGYLRLNVSHFVPDSSEEGLGDQKPKRARTKDVALPSPGNSSRRREGKVGKDPTAPPPVVERIRPPKSGRSVSLRNAAAESPSRRLDDTQRSRARSSSLLSLEARATEGAEDSPLPPAPELVLKAHGRGTSLAPTNRFETIHLTVLPEYLESQVREVIAQDQLGNKIKTMVYADTTRTLINPVDSPDLHFSWTINPYRGCEHGCIYCYARPGHEYLSLNMGIDFESKVFAKYDAPALLRKELMRSSWKGEGIVLSGVTDPYQPIERELNITRELLKVCIEFRQPVSIITKNKLILRDIDLLARLHEFGAVRCAVSLTTLDVILASKMEPRASSPSSRLETIRALATVGIPVTVMTAPIIPGINDHELPALLAAASKAGATRAGYVLLRLPHQIKDLFISWLHEHFPDRAAKVETLLRDAREGMLYNAEFFERGRGTGPIARHIADTFALFARRHGLASPRMVAMDPAQDRPTPFRRPPGPQGLLFGSDA